MMSEICSMGRGRLNTKLIEVNLMGCKCYTKCVGPIGGTKIEESVWESFERHCGIVVCGACRLSPNIEHTTANKPRRCYSSTVPEMVCCSVDGNSSYVFVLSCYWRYTNNTKWANSIKKFS